MPETSAINSKLKVLFLLDFYPFPENLDGRTKVVANILNRLPDSIEFKIICFLKPCQIPILAADNIRIVKTKELSKIKKFINRLCFLPVNAIAQKVIISGINEKLSDFEVIHTATDSFITLNGLHPKIIVGVNDSYSKYYQNKSFIKSIYFRLLEINLSFKNLYYYLVTNSDAINFMTRKKLVISNGVDRTIFYQNTNHIIEPNTFVFHGVLDYEPNKNAIYEMSTFLNENLSQGKLFVVGRCNRVTENDLQNEFSHLSNVTFIGEVKNITNEISKYQFYISLMSSGSGLKNKLLEAMSCGCVILVNEKAIEGLLKEDLLYESLYVIRNKDDLHNAIRDSKGWEEKRKNAVKYIEKNYTWENTIIELVRFYNKSMNL